MQFQDLLDQVAEALKDAGIGARASRARPTSARPSSRPSRSRGLKDGRAARAHPQPARRVAAGANLTQASHAIFVHPLLVSSQIEYTSCDTQAVGRIRRYGQGRVVQLYRFLVANSIDEDIFRDRRQPPTPRA